MLPLVLLFPRKAQLFLKSHLLQASLVIPTSNFYQLNIIKFASFNDDPVGGAGPQKDGAPRSCRDPDLGRNSVLQGLLHTNLVLRFTYEHYQVKI
jgi:hypothetical protein